MLITKVVKKGRIKVLEDGVYTHKYPGDLIILHESDAERLKDKLMDVSDKTNTAKLIQEIADGETISKVKHLDEIQNIRKKLDMDNIVALKGKDEIINNKNKEIEHLEFQVENLKSEIKAKLTDPDKENLEKQLLSYEKLLEKQSNDIADYQKTIEKLDKEIETLKSVKNKK